MLGRKIKHAHRYQEIINAFLRNGFHYFIYRLGFTNPYLPKKQHKMEEHYTMQTIGAKLRHTLQELGPTFIKLGQIASTRRDLIPEAITKELELLQDQVTAFSYEQVKECMEEELGGLPEKLFREFNETPLATASIGQVHAAVLKTGEPVAVKIQRPDILPIVETDLEILDDLARIMEENFSWAKTYQIRKMMNEFARSLHAELDYLMEARNSERIAKPFIDQPEIYIPGVYWNLTTKKILTMDFVQGIKINNLKKLEEEKYDRKLIAKRIIESMLQQILIDGFFHGDPHPGNIYVLPGERIAYLDFGLVGRLSEETKFYFASLVIQLQKGDTKGMVKTISSMGILSAETDLSSLNHAIDELQMKYYDTPFAHIKLGETVNDLFTIIFQHHIQIPTDMTIVGKTLLTIEGIVVDLDPEISIMQAIKPFGEKLIRQHYGPKQVMKNSLTDFLENARLISDVPKKLSALTSTVQKGKLHVEIGVPELRNFLKRLDKISNRLAFSIILLSFSILMVGLIIGSAISGESSVLWNFHVIEFGSIVATTMFIFMLIAIFKSGRM
ncbi:ABC1 kinase family protein [Bacillus benzoevorans]|uniref:Ubiquinone biosynthesis protein n=1 Tax=Bacillus benzoevorans TaxID=1456 RepID=A0A7X0HPX2_9BACI|nr:AarF/ABC1/UbiB kinase family protein [Bacillus benzoevorans]MBB6443597.1 ubiquinone biosynthesis protein [Bacillus benzoevorans]